MTQSCWIEHYRTCTLYNFLCRITKLLLYFFSIIGLHDSLQMSHKRLIIYDIFNRQKWTIKIKEKQLSFCFYRVHNISNQSFNFYDDFPFISSCYGIFNLVQKIMFKSLLEQKILCQCGVISRISKFRLRLNGLIVYFVPIPHLTTCANHHIIYENGKIAR